MTALVLKSRTIYALVVTHFLSLGSKKKHELNPSFSLNRKKETGKQTLYPPELSIMSMSIRSSNSVLLNIVIMLLQTKKIVFILVSKLIRLVSI